MADLEDKITSAEDMTPFGSPSRALHDIKGGCVSMPWWLKREWLRIEGKVYPECTEVINYINNQMPQYALHISKQDPLFVAYTPDKVSGESDRQLKTSIGKFITKYYPHLKDEVVQALVADHLGELDNTFEILTGEAITEVYRKSGGTSACMSKSLADYPGAAGHHPSEAYWAPNISMAVLRNATGDVTARSMLFTPSETDKRFIRVYGDLKLRKKLLRSGYIQGTWVGAEFNTIVVPCPNADKVRFVLPYLDCNGTTASPVGSTVTYYDSKVRCVSEEMGRKLRTVGGISATVCAANTGGYYELTPVSSAESIVKCAVSGVDIDLMIEDAYKYFKDDVLVSVCKAVADVSNAALYRFEVNAHTQLVKISTDTLTYTHNYEIFIDTPEQRRFSGYERLSSKYYTEPEWLLRTRYSSGVTYRETVHGLIKPEDAVQVISLNSQGKAIATYIHQQEVTKGWVKVHSVKRGEAVWAEPTVGIVKTLGGRKVVPGVHAVQQTYDSKWEFSRNLVVRYALGRFSYSDVKSATPIAEHSPSMYSLIRGVLLADKPLGKPLGNLEAAACRHISETFRYSTVNGVQLYRKALTRLKDAEGCEAIEESDMYKHLKYILDVHNAEANAIDYNDQHVGPVKEELTAPPDVIVQELEELV